ncbi:hypothetical protein D3C81_1799300 [compost metagenome]
MDLAAFVVCDKADHQGMGEGPLLAAEIADIGHGNPNLLFCFPADAVLQCLSRLHEACDETVHIIGKMLGPGEEYLPVLEDDGNYRRRQSGKAHTSASRAQQGMLLGRRNGFGAAGAAKAVGKPKCCQLHSPTCQMEQPFVHFAIEAA